MKREDDVKIIHCPPGFAFGYVLHSHDTKNIAELHDETPACNVAAETLKYRMGFGR